MAEQFANRAESTLAAGVAAGATSLAVVSGHGSKFSPSGDFSILLEDATNPDVYELVKATGRSGDTLTVTATTLAWDIGDKVVQILDKRVMDLIVADLAGKQALSDHDRFVGARAGRITSTQAVANATLQGVLFNTETFDTHNFHDNTTNPARFTIPAGVVGLYRVSAHINMSFSASTNANIYIMKNGSAVSFGQSQVTGTTALQIEDVISLALNDYIEIAVFVTTGTATIDSLADRVYASIEYLGAVV